jgi:hypothetical protein
LSILALLDADGNEILTEENELVQSHGSLRDADGAGRNTRRQNLVPHTRTSIFQPLDDDMNVARVRLNSVPFNGRWMADLGEQSSQSVNQPAPLMTNDTPLLTLGSTTPFYVDPLPIPLTAIRPSLFIPDTNKDRAVRPRIPKQASFAGR